MAVPELATEVAPVNSKRELSREWKAFFHNPLAWAGMGLMAFLVALCWLGPVLWHSNMYTMNLSASLQPPTAAHPLGTDEVGRDVLLRLMVGGQVSLIVGFASAVVGSLAGALYGLVSAHYGGIVDTVLMRIVDITLAVPSLFLLLLLDSIFTPNATVIVFIIAITSWQGIARIVRGEVMSLKERPYVEAAHAVGASNWRIITKHYLPNVVGPLMVYTTFGVGNGILTIAALSFLGLGLTPPAPNWGQMLSDAQNYLFQNPWWLIYPPGLLIVFSQLAAMFLGDAFNQAFDPRLKRGA